MSAPLFLYGPMARRDFLKAALEPHLADITCQKALLRGHNLSAEARPVSLPGLVVGTGTVAGCVITDPAAAATLLYIAEVLDLGSPVPVTVEIDGQARSARALCGHPGPVVWRDAEWPDASQAILCEAVPEIRADMEHRPAAELAATGAMILSRAAARVAARDSAPTDLRSKTDRDEIEEIRIETPHTGFFRSHRYHLRHPRFDGAQSPVLQREVFVATDAALVLPYDPVRDRVLLVEQFRMGPYGRGDPRPWMLEPVAGRIDAGETPEETAYRECREEAGLDLRGLEKISTHYCTPGYSTEVFHLFLGLCDLPDVAQGRGGLASENEDIRSHVIGFDRAMALLHSGEANNGPLVLALLWLQRERARLHAAA